MPKAIKKRPEKKKPVQEEEVKSAALQALEAAKEKQKHLIIGISAVVAIIIIYIAYSLYSSSVSQKAYDLQLQADRFFYAIDISQSMPAEDRWKKALELYKQSMDLMSNPATLFYIGNCYFNLGEYDKAINEYTRFTEKYIGEKELVPLVYQKIASAYFRTDRPGPAIETLGKLAEISNGIFRDIALVSEARYYEEAGEKEKSLERYTEIINGYPTSPWLAEARARVAVKEAKQDKENTAGSETTESLGGKPSETEKPAE